jgi:hypothetical protein
MVSILLSGGKAMLFWSYLFSVCRPKWQLYACEEGGGRIDRQFAHFEQPYQLTLPNSSEQRYVGRNGAMSKGFLVYQKVKISKKDTATGRMETRRQQKQKLQEMGRPRFVRRASRKSPPHTPARGS